MSGEERGRRIQEIIEAEKYLLRPLTEEEVTKMGQQLREVISQIPGFDSLTDEQQQVAWEFGSVLKCGVIVAELLGRSPSPLRWDLKDQIDVALETAEKIGVGLTREIANVAVAEAKKAMSSK